MNIQDYVPTNFEPMKFHSLKCLWLHNRKTELLLYYLRQVPIGDVEAFKKIAPVTSSVEQLQRETGMSIEDIYEYSNIGGYIHEFLEILNMSSEEVQTFIDDYEADPPELDPEDQASIDEMCRDIDTHIKQKKKTVQEFNNIINQNFNDDI
jgi:DNA-binding transcriptional MerR regulator